VFWLSGAAAITESLDGGLDCGYVQSVNVWHWLTSAQSHHFVYCGQLNALEAFAWIEWWVFSKHITNVIEILCRSFLTFGFVFVIIVAIRAGRRGDGYRGPVVPK